MRGAYAWTRAACACRAALIRCPASSPRSPASHMSTAPASASLRFGRFELQPHERRLLADGQEAALGARAFDVLLALAQRPGRLVSKRDLMDLVWPDVVVEENNLAAQV